MKEYEILEHTAELKIRAFGKSKQELFCHCLQAMAKSQKPRLKEARLAQQSWAAKIKSQKAIERKIKIKSQDINTLLVDFLSECLYLSQVNREIYQDIKFKKFVDTQLEGELFGQKVERFGEEVKAVTYHGLDIKQNPKGLWQAEVIFDV